MARRVPGGHLNDWLTGVVLAVVALAAMGAIFVYAGGNDARAPLQVTALAGQVERVREGEATPARLGMHIGAGDRFQTGPGSVTFGRGGDGMVTLPEQTTVDVVRVDEAGIELGLARGRLRAVVRPDEDSVRVTSKGRSVLATDATFSAAVDDTGTFSVEVEQGRVLPEGLADVAELTAPVRLDVFSDGSTALGPIPDDLLLSVAWPEPVARPTVLLQGRATPGAQVRIQAQEATAETRADATGAFAVEIALAQGENAVTLTLTDAFGRSQQAQGTVRRTERPGRAALDVSVDYSR